MIDQRFMSKYRIRQSNEFEFVFHRKCSVADDVLVIYGRENSLRHTRIGLTVSRKIGNAVKRNRWKRLLREAFRLSKADLPGGIDIVVIPRNTADPSLEVLLKSFPKIILRVHRRLQKK